MQTTHKTTFQSSVQAGFVAAGYAYQQTSRSPLVFRHPSKTRLDSLRAKFTVGRIWYELGHEVGQRNMQQLRDIIRECAVLEGLRGRSVSETFTELWFMAHRLLVRDKQSIDAARRIMTRLCMMRRKLPVEGD